MKCQHVQKLKVSRQHIFSLFFVYGLPRFIIGTCNKHHYKMPRLFNNGSHTKEFPFFIYFFSFMRRWLEGAYCNTKRVAFCNFLPLSTCFSTSFRSISGPSPKPLPSNVQRDASPAHEFRGDLLGDEAGSRGFGIDGDVHVPAGWAPRWLPRSDTEKVAELILVYGRYNEPVYEVNGGFVMVYNHKMGPPSDVCWFITPRIEQRGTTWWRWFPVKIFP